MTKRSRQIGQILALKKVEESSPAATVTFREESKWRCWEQLCILDIKITDNAGEIRFGYSRGALLFGSIIRKSPPWKRGDPNVSPVSLRARMHQFLNKRKTPLRPILKDFDVGVRPPGSRTRTLAQSSPPYTPIPKHSGPFEDAGSESLICGCIGNFPDNGAGAWSAIVTVISNSVQKSPSTENLSALFRPTRSHVLAPSLSRHLHTMTFDL